MGLSLAAMEVAWVGTWVSPNSFADVLVLKGEIMTEFDVLWSRGVFEQTRAAGLSKAKAGTSKHAQRLQHLEAVDRVIVELLSNPDHLAQVTLEIKGSIPWYNRWAVLLIGSDASNFLSIPVRKLFELDPGLIQPIRRRIIMNTTTTSYKFDFDGIVFSTNEKSQMGSPIFANHYMKGTNESETAILADYVALSQTFAIVEARPSKVVENSTGIVYRTDDEVVAAWLPKRNRDMYAWKPGVPVFEQNSNLFDHLRKQLFRALRAGKTVVQEEIDREGLANLAEIFGKSTAQLAEEAKNKWLNLLERNAQIDWERCEPGDELAWWERNEGKTPRSRFVRNGADTVIYSKTEYLLPPNGNNIRIIVRETRHLEEPQFELIEMDRRSLAAKRFLETFANAATKDRLGSSAAFGYFVASASSYHRFSDRVMASGNYEYSNHIPVDGSDPDPDRPAEGAPLYTDWTNPVGPITWKAWVSQELAEIKKEIGELFPEGRMTPEIELWNKRPDGTFQLSLTFRRADGWKFSLKIVTTNERLHEAAAAMLAYFQQENPEVNRQFVFLDPVI